jgi:hypothetical protein
MTDTLKSLRRDLEDMREELSLAGLLRPKRNLGDPVTDGKWSGFGTEWSVRYIYRCECGSLHEGVTAIPANSSDGGVYQVLNPACGCTTACRIWKGVPTATIVVKKETSAVDKFNAYQTQKQ